VLKAEKRLQIVAINTESNSIRISVVTSPPASFRCSSLHCTNWIASRNPPVCWNLITARTVVFLELYSSDWNYVIYSKSCWKDELNKKKSLLYFKCTAPVRVTLGESFSLAQPFFSFSLTSAHFRNIRNCSRLFGLAVSVWQIRSVRFSHGTFRSLQFCTYGTDEICEICWC